MKLFLSTLFVCLLIVACVPAQYPARVLVRDQHGRIVVSESPSIEAVHRPFRRIIRQVDLISVAQINPAYTSAYSPYVDENASSAAVLAELKALHGRLDLHQRSLEALLTRQGVQPIVIPAQPIVVGSQPQLIPTPRVEGSVLSGLAVLQSKCASCHQEGKMKPEQRFRILTADGKLAPLTDLQQRKILTRTYNQSMPPAVNLYGITPLVDQEYAALVDLLQ